MRFLFACMAAFHCCLMLASGTWTVFNQIWLPLGLGTECFLFGMTLLYAHAAVGNGDPWARAYWTRGRMTAFAAGVTGAGVQLFVTDLFVKGLLPQCWLVVSMVCIAAGLASFVIGRIAFPQSWRLESNDRHRWRSFRHMTQMGLVIYAGLLVALVAGGLALAVGERPVEELLAERGVPWQLLCLVVSAPLAELAMLDALSGE